MNVEKVFQSRKIQHSKLRSDNVSLRRKLNKILEYAEKNEATITKLREVEDVLLEYGSVAELLADLPDRLAAEFSVDVVTIAVDESMRLGTDIPFSADSALHSNCFYVEPPALTEQFAPSFQPLLRGRISEGAKNFFPVLKRKSIRSEALVPLLLHGRMFGSLNFGSTAPNRYDDSMGADLLRQLGHRVAVIFNYLVVMEENYHLRKKVELLKMKLNAESPAVKSLDAQVKVPEAKLAAQD